MFRKKIEIKASTLLKTSEKKKFRNAVSSAFTHQRDGTFEKNDDEAETVLPAELHSSLVKNDVASTKAATDNGNRQFEFYSLDKTPIFFLGESRLYPTVYLLWLAPDLLPRLYTHSEVFEKLKTGADLMLPGIITSISGSSFNFRRDSAVAICINGNDAPVAVGLALMSGEEMLTSAERKGKAVQILHTYQDSLWELGPKSRVPTITLPRPTVQSQNDENISKESESALATSENVVPANIGSNIGDDNEQNRDALDNDTLFLLYFLYAIQKRLRRDDELPVLASTFYGSVLLPLMPSEEEKITVQRTSYKKFSTFLRTMQEEGVIKIDEPKKGVENIAHINRGHEIFRRYSEQLKSLPTADKTAEASSSVVNERPVNFRELRAITAPVLPLFQEVNKALKKGQALSATDVRSVITSYVKSKELANGRMVKLDDLLSKCMSTSVADQRQSVDQVPWESIMESIFNRMTPCVEIEFADHGSATLGDSRKEVRKGKPPSIRMRVAKRAGNKKVTMIDNVEAFGIDPKSLAQELQVTLAVSATLNDSPGSEGAQVQVQGDQQTQLQKILTEKYGISKKYLQIA